MKKTYRIARSYFLFTSVAGLLSLQFVSCAIAGAPVPEAPGGEAATNTVTNKGCGNASANPGSGNAAANKGSGNAAANPGSGNAAANPGSGHTAANLGSGNAAANSGSGNAAANSGSSNAAANSESGNAEANSGSSNATANSGSGNAAANPGSGNASPPAASAAESSAVVPKRKHAPLGLNPGEKFKIAGYAEQQPTSVVMDKASDDKPPALHRAQMRLTGSMCYACLLEFQDKIKQVFGVERARVAKSEQVSIQTLSPDLANWADAVFIYDANKLDLLDLRAFIRGNGYYPYKVVDKEVNVLPPEDQKKI